MNVSLLTQNHASSITLPEKVHGTYKISIVEDEVEVSVQIEARDGSWFFSPCRGVDILDESGTTLDNMQLESGCIRVIQHEALKEKSLVLVEESTADTAEFGKWLIRDGAAVTLGRGEDNAVIVGNEYVSKHHLSLSYVADSWTLTDLKSANGTYVNGRRCVGSQALSYGDVVAVMGVRVIVGRRYFAINNPNGIVRISSPGLEAYLPQEVVEREPGEIIQEEQFYRSPRFKRDIVPYRLKIDLPPQDQIGDEIPMMMAVGPAMTMGMASMASGIYGVMNGNTMSAITSGCMLMGTVLWPILSRKYEKKKKAKKEAMRLYKYRSYLDRLKSGFLEESVYQREIQLENVVSIEDCENRILNRSRNLWERAQSQNDFLQVRVGTGDIDLQTDIQCPERKFEIEEDILEEELYALMDEPKKLIEVPIAVSLFENYVTGVIGDRRAVNDFVNGLIIQLASLYSYDEVKLVFITGTQDFSYVRWLPHAWSDDKNQRYYATNVDNLRELASFFEREVEARGELSEDQLPAAMPYYVVFALDRELSIRADFIKDICKATTNRNFSVLCFYDELRYLPKECSNVIELRSEKEGVIYDKNDTSGATIEFCPDVYVPRTRMDHLCISAANISMSISDSGYQLPKMITFLEMFDAGKVEHLNVVSRWRENDPTKSLGAQVGVNPYGDPFILDLHEKKDGPHGLVAGMTGSGKSEFIMTYILSLAINYSPEEVAFILIDYKGGGMAKTFEDLPHTAGIITNLDGAAVNRSLISIQSELKRRQAIFAQVSSQSGISNIDIYKYQKMHREGKVSEPLQHLFIISDEFAELKTQQPEFMAQLVSAARIGRSLGVHLILATQKPAGVVDDQIWSNSRFRVCLKVQDKADSMDMLKRPEAAELQDTGRFYLQVGYNEFFQMGQSAWAGAPYYPADHVEVQLDDSVDVVDNVGRIIVSNRLDKKKALFKNPSKQIDTITEYISQIAQMENIVVRQLWLEPIPEFIYVNSLREKYHWQKTSEINPVIGEYDDPMNQAQHLLTLPLTKKGNAVVYGMAGGGKTTFMTSFVFSLISSYTPEEVNLYIVDFASETLTAFSKAPHVGDVVLSHEKEKTENLVKLLLGQMQTRKKLLAEYGGDFVAYNKDASVKLPTIVTCIHGYAAFADLYEAQVPAIMQLTRESSKYGIYFVLTGIATSDIGFRLLQSFGQVFALQLADEADYASMVGKTDGLIPAKFKGRGLAKFDNVYEFQVAHALDGDSMHTELREYCAKARAKARITARRIPVLPEVVDMDFIREYVEKGSLNVPIGVETATMEVSYFDMARNYITTVQSRDDEYITFANELSKMLVYEVGSTTKIFDSESLHDEISDADLCHSVPEISAGVEELFKTVVERHNARKAAMENGEAAPEYERLVVHIVGLLSLRSMLDEKHTEMLDLIFERGAVALGVHIIISDSSKNISSFAYSKWFKANFSASDAVWIGGGITDQFVIKTTKTTSEMYGELDSRYGFSVFKGRATKIKVLTEAVEE